MIKGVYIKKVLEEQKKPLKAKEIMDIILNDYPELNITKKEVNSILSTEMRDEVIRNVNNYTYNLKSEIDLNNVGEKNIEKNEVVLFSGIDKEIVYINNLLISSEDGLTTSQISKLLYDTYDIKVSKTIVKNYLWSYFRNIIKYNASNYSYKLEGDTFLLDDIIVISNKNMPRALNANFLGSKIEVEYNDNINIKTLVKAITILNFKSLKSMKEADLFKLLNRTIEKINNDED